MLVGPRLYARYQSQKNHEHYYPHLYPSSADAIPGEELNVQVDADKRKKTIKSRIHQNMLLLHQTGSVKVGEVVRYTLTYTPSLDRILPPPQQLHIKVKNTSAVPLRAAYLHGPYTLYASCYPSTFNPYVKQERVQEEGAPDYEPQLKAGGSWSSKLTVPDEVRADAEHGSKLRDSERKTFTWIIEIASQVLFSTSASVHFELLVGRDEKSVALGITGVVSVGAGQGLPGRLEDIQSKRTELKAEVQSRGVFSKAIRLAVDDTETLWNTPPFPSWDGHGDVDVKQGPEHGDKRDTKDKKDEKQGKQKKIHLVILTHGLHSNLGADMLYMKESIDSAAKQAKEDAKQRRAEMKLKQAEQDYEFGREAAHLRSKSVPEITIAPVPGVEEEEDEEQVLVRGFNGNSVRTERGIQYLGKRLAKYVLSITYPDQPFLPVKTSSLKTITRTLTGQKPHEDKNNLKPIHKNSSIMKDEEHTNHNLAYRITSISFIGHSLGGLVQTYAAAYIQKHSPEFFERIKPVNFVALASPFLGLSNENPMYVKFALDFGLVGRTGQDLGLAWRAPTIARNGWGAIVNGLVNDPHKNQQPDPRAKPLLRILPTGPAHQALKQFRNRTVYSNVVNDGIVPLRTSCLLFLDWRGLERVEKARRENGLIGTMVNWGWNEMMGQNASTAKKPLSWNDFFSDNADDSDRPSEDFGSTVPDARASQYLDADRKGSLSDDGIQETTDKTDNTGTGKEDAKEQETNVWTGLLSWFRPHAGSKTAETRSSTSRPKKTSRGKKTPRIYQRGQIKDMDDSDLTSPENASPTDANFDKPPGPVRGSSLYTNNSAEENLEAPPKTTVFESAGDLLSPPLPPKEYLLDPAARPRTIFHDRVYHPEDIPPPPSKKPRLLSRLSTGRSGSTSPTSPTQARNDTDRTSSNRSESGDTGTMKIEEKIARAYHKNMAWRKVLVSMEPDAHNNMIVRRMFANAYGWPVVKHMCDTHFAFTASAQTRDDDENPRERAKPQSEAVGRTGEQVKGQVDPPKDEQIETIKHEEPEARSRSVDHASAHLSNRVESPKTSQQLINSLPERVRSRESKDKQRDRSTSELREARDELSDLVSMTNVTARGTPSSTYSSSTHSGTAALHRLARQDSSRWSDRFFDGSDQDSDEDDEAYFEELRKVRQRGDLSAAEWNQIRQASLDYNQQQSTLKGDRGKLSRHPETGQLITDAGVIVDEPDSMSLASRRSSRQEEVDPHLLSLTGVGLGKPASEQILETAEEHDPRHDGLKGSKGKRRTSVTEQVAVASTHNQHDRRV